MVDLVTNMEKEKLQTVFYDSQQMNINFNNQDDAEEAEEMEDRIRKNAEIADNLNRYLNIQDETFDSPENSLNQPRFDNEITRLQHELQAKSNEVEHYKKMLLDEKVRSSNDIGELHKRLTIAEAEKEKSIITRQQTHELLVQRYCFFILPIFSNKTATSLRQLSKYLRNHN